MSDRQIFASSQLGSHLNDTARRVLWRDLYAEQVTSNEVGMADDCQFDVTLSSPYAIRIVRCSLWPFEIGAEELYVDPISAIFITRRILMKGSLRIRLLASAILGAGLSVVFAAPAQANCSYTGGDFTCGSTVTANSSFVFPYVAPVNDREYVFPSGPAGTNGSLTVSTGANVTGYGLALSSVGPGPNLSFTNNGSVQIDAGNTATAGGNAAVNVTGSGAVNVTYTGTGNVSNLGTGDGLALATTTGTITVGNTGNVTAAAGNGILTTSTTGNQVINIGGNVVGTVNDGVNATSTSGTLTVNVLGGNVTGVDDAMQLSSTGASIVNVSATRSLTGNFGVFSTNGGTLVVNNSGIITGNVLAVFTNTDATTVNNATGGTINGRFNLSSLGDTISNSGTLNSVAGTLLADGDDTINNNANGVINLSGSINFGLGVDALLNAANATINILGDSSFVGLELFTQSGRINLNANTLTLSGTPFSNTGTIDTSGNASILGVTSFSNAGSLDLAAGTFTVPAVAFTNSGTIFADEGNSTITGQTSFANSGTIDLQDGAVGDNLTIASSFVGSGGSNLLVDVSDVASDTLTVGAASGTTTVNANFVGTGLINLDGVLVVDTASTTANAFILGAVGGNTSPLVDYALVQSGSDFFLTAAPTAEAFDPVVISNMAGSLWYQSADEVIAQTDLPSGLDGLGAWGQVYYSQDKYGDDDDVAVIDGTVFAVDNELKTDRYGIQAGVEYGFGGARIGLTGGYGVAKADNDLNNDLKAKGWNLGIYGAFGGLTGFHGSALLKHDRYKVDFDGGAFDGVDAKLRATGVDGSLGYRFGIGGEATLDAKVGLSHVRTKINDVSAFGFDYDIGTVTSTRGRAGLRAAFGGNLGLYAEGSVLREFDGDGNVELFDGATFYDIESSGKGTWFRLEAGLAPQVGSGPILAAWADLGDKKGFGVRAGFRFGGARVEEVLPPPPPPMMAPPPPPPPATQTCPDGSVILATDICPPPPPPPPPAPEPERG